MKNIFVILFLLISTASFSQQILKHNPYSVFPIGQELVSNGDFEDGGTDWFDVVETTFTGGEAVCEIVTAFRYCFRQNIAIQNNHTYRVTFDITNYTSGNFKVGLGDKDVGTYTPSLSGNGNYSYDLTPTTATFEVAAIGFSVFEGNFDNISVKEIF